uniref:UspA domain-containing protein n=1 Tax=Biomphalaria glabrata TaxID=6526 RepID=A0A2C9JZL7_BIOGL
MSRISYDTVKGQMSRISYDTVKGQMSSISYDTVKGQMSSISYDTVKGQMSSISYDTVKGQMSSISYDTVKGQMSRISYDTVKGQMSSVKYVFDRELVDQKLREGEEQVHGQLEQFKDILLQHSAHGKVRAVSAKNPGDAILKTADEEKCDLIVIGCKGRSAFRRTLLGTISDHVVHHANVPVVVCRNKMLRRKSSAIVPPNPEELQVSGK